MSFHKVPETGLAQVGDSDIERRLTEVAVIEEEMGEEKNLVIGKKWRCVVLVAVLLVLGGAGVGLWQTGLFGDAGGRDKVTDKLLGGENTDVDKDVGEEHIDGMIIADTTTIGDTTTKLNVQADERNHVHKETQKMKEGKDSNKTTEHNIAAFGENTNKPEEYTQTTESASHRSNTNYRPVEDSTQTTEINTHTNENHDWSEQDYSNTETTKVEDETVEYNTQTTHDIIEVTTIMKDSVFGWLSPPLSTTVL